MIKRTFAVLGLLLLLAGLGLGWYMTSRLQQARALDGTTSGEGLGDACAHPHPVIEVSNRTMSEADTQALVVRLNNSSAETCIFTVTLNAPNFELGANSMQSVEVPPEAIATLSWIITPKRVGTFQIVAQSGLDTAVVGVTVVNVLGLSAWQVQLLSLVSTFLGPMLSAPWLYEQFFKRSKRRR